MRLFTWIVTFLLCLPAAAVVEITSISRVSNFTENDEGKVAKIFGGIANSPAGCSGDSSLCNNCDTKDTACNPVRIHTALNMKFDFKVTGSTSGFLNAGIDFSGSYINLPLQASSSTGNLSENDTGTGYVNWGNICTALGVTGCDINGATGNLIIGLSSSLDTEPDSGDRISIPIDVTVPNGDPADIEGDSYDLLDCDDASPAAGICNFLAYPGDKKIFIDNLQEVGAWPASNTVKIKALRIYYSTVSFDDANYDKTNEYIDVELDSSGVPVTDIVDGLQNDQLYFFRPAVVDEANNVAFLVEERQIDDAGFIGGTGCAADTDANCDLIATPSEVIGLLTDDINCFITTAAYGSSMAPQVRDFRKFRNKYLLRSEWGKRINSLYYEYGPYGARFLQKYDYLKPVARVALQPLAYLVRNSNRHGLSVLFFGLFSFGIFIIGLVIGGRQLWRKLS